MGFEGFIGGFMVLYGFFEVFFRCFGCFIWVYGFFRCFEVF
jgi:hypothetical protein